MTHSFPRSWRELFLALPVLLATLLFLAASVPVFLLFVRNHMDEKKIAEEVHATEALGFDMTSLDRAIHAAFLSALSKKEPESDRYVLGMSLQARAVLSDLARRSPFLSPGMRRSLTDIARDSDRYFFGLARNLPGSSPAPSENLSRDYRRLSFRIASFSYEIDKQLRRETLHLASLYRTRSTLILLQSVLTLLYAGAILFFSTSRRHTHQVLLDFAAENSEEMIVLTDLRGRILFANRRFRALFCKAPAGCEAIPLADILRETPSLGEAALEWEAFLADPGAPRQHLLPFRSPSLPALTWLMVQMTPTRIGRRSRYLEWKGSDVSRLKNAELALEAQGEWLRTTLASIGDGVIATDVSGTITFINQVAERLTGYGVDEALGRPVDEIFRIVNEKTGERVEVPIERVLKNDIVVGLANHTALIGRSGDITSISDSAAPIHSRDGLLTGVVMVFQENTERRRAQEMIWNLTYRDTLTHLPNQSLFQDRLATLLPWARSNRRLLAVGMVDIDLFKRINDSLGHGAGNEVLQALSRRFSGLLSPNDTLARIGGDEFLVMLTQCPTEKDVALFCDRLLRSLENPFEVAGQEIALTASLGVALFPRDGESPEDLVKNADIALNRAKEAGRNRVLFFEEAMSSASLRDLQLEQALKQALLRGEFFLEYQPQIETQSGKIVGAEALVRWDSPDAGHVSPLDFIPLAERTGLIVPIGNTVLRMAMEQAKRWRTDGNRISVSVNISYHHFVREGFVEEVLSILEKVGVPPEVLLLEITESEVIKDSDNFFSVVEALHRQGIRISIDDFGTGATALSYLTTYPIAEVKIDRSLVTNLFSDLKRSELVRTIIGLGKRLDFTTTAEGVESREEWDYLEKHQCDRIQGFFASRPLAPKALEALFGKRFAQQDRDIPSWIDN